MHKSRSLAAFSLIFVLCLSNFAFAQPSVGVQAGQWIEYSVTYTGVPSEGHDISFARMQILDVEGTSIHVTIMSQYANGSRETMNSTLNLSTGQLIDNFIIPANLNVGDTFFAQYLGNVTISQTQQQTYAGATRTVLSATVGNNSYVWDKATGVSVEGTSEQPDYTMRTVVSDTNMWQPQKESVSFAIWLAVTVVVFTVAVLVAVLLIRRKWGS